MGPPRERGAAGDGVGQPAESARAGEQAAFHLGQAEAAIVGRDDQVAGEAQFEAAAEGAASVGKFVTDIPKLLGQAERAADAFSAVAEEGLRLDNDTVQRLAEAQSRKNRATRIGIWVGAIALAVIALALLF